MENSKLDQNQSKALIYCRVSSERQVIDGHGLDSQEKRCRDYAASHGYIVKEVFADEGISGGLFDRPAMKLLIQHLDSHPDEQYVIIFDDLSRFARDVKVHIQLRGELKSRGAKIECLNFNMDDSIEGEYAELIMAAGNQYQRKQNRRQVIQKMKARLEAGYWPFGPPPGLKNEKDQIRGKVLKPTSPLSTIYKVAIEKYRIRELLTLEEVRAFILQKYKDNGITKKLSINGTRNILTELLYTGYIEYPKWQFPRRKGQHEGFISLETHEAVLDILNERSKPTIRKDYDLDFPLRPYMLCKHCGVPMTASWHKGRSKKYPHYWCKNKKCQYWSKTIHRDKIEAEFEALLSKIKLSKELVELTRTIFIQLWTESKQGYLNEKILTKKEIKEIGRKLQGLVEKVINTSNQTVIKIYEEEIAKLEAEKRRLETQQEIELFSEKDVGTALDSVLTVLNNPLLIWKNEGVEWKRNLIFMYFECNLAYDYQLGFGTAALALPVRLIGEICTSKLKRVEMPGIGPGSGETLGYKCLVRDSIFLLHPASGNIQT